MYCQVHSEDESEFSAVLAPTRAGLELKVDFYGHGMHPPHALHSEGHQDSMGIFLFLALAEYLSNGAPSFVVLDDVLMSVDRQHRRAVAKMLSEQFPETQFLLTTHDEVWWRQLRTESVVSGANALRINGWNIDDGPVIGETAGDLVGHARMHLGQGHVPSAAHALRRACEAYLPELYLIAAHSKSFLSRTNCVIGLRRLFRRHQLLSHQGSSSYSGPRRPNPSF
jgi:energy-coupling factor transporter ATP-binding protein EcfA2